MSRNQDGLSYGQNIAIATHQANTAADAACAITDMFYNGEVANYTGMYGLANPTARPVLDCPGCGDEETGHFTQVVWAATTMVGCATQDCTNNAHFFNTETNQIQYWPAEDRMFYTVCNYQEAGNMGGEYGTNVGIPLGHATVWANASAW